MEAIRVIKSLPLNSRWWDSDSGCWKIKAEVYYQLAASLKDVLPHFSSELLRSKKYSSVRLAIENAKRKATARVQESYSTASNIAIPAPKGLEYLPFQKAGIAFALKRKRILLADDMGLGKTIQSIGVINALHRNCKKILIISPAIAKLNWEQELHKWLVLSRSIEVAYSNKTFPSSDIVVINYDIVAKHEKQIRGREWDLLIADECHYLKNRKAKRTAVVLGARNKKGIQATRKIFLTGTPIVNYPVEIYGIANHLMNGGLGTFKSFVEAYTEPRRTHFGMDYTKSKDLELLKNKLRQSIMIRRLKKEVLKELPDKIRQIIEIPMDGVEEQLSFKMKKMLSAAIVNSSKELSEKEFEKEIKKLKIDLEEQDFETISQIRHATSIKKIPFVIEHIKNILQSKDKLVVFAHHKKVVSALYTEFKKVAVSLTGSHTSKQKQYAVDTFQNEDSCKLFIGSIQSSGVAVTLTASSHIVFAELDWVPGNMSQAEDRCHRIGQGNSVLIQHIVFEGSLDCFIAKKLVKKQTAINAVLN